METSSEKKLVGEDWKYSGYGFKTICCRFKIKTDKSKEREIWNLKFSNAPESRLKIVSRKKNADLARAKHTPNKNTINKGGRGGAGKAAQTPPLLIRTESLARGLDA